MTLLEFTSEKSVRNWRTQNDGVMGGVSNSTAKFITHDRNETGILCFSGEVSLKHNGGFAQILYEASNFNLRAYQGVTLRVKGDNKRYQLRLKTNAANLAYTQAFNTTRNWQDIHLNFINFHATHRGNTVPNAPDINLADIRSVGILISNKQEGCFKLLIRTISAYTTHPDHSSA